MTTAIFSPRTSGCVFPTVGDWPQAVLLFFFHVRRFDHGLTGGAPVLRSSSHDVFGQAADSQKRLYFLFSLYHYHLSFCAHIDLMRNSSILEVAMQTQDVVLVHHSISVSGVALFFVHN